MGRELMKAEVAEIFGCSLPTVDAWLREGIPVKREGGRGVAYAFDSVDVHRWLIGREKRPGRPPKNPGAALDVDPETGEKRITIDEALRRKAVADAKKSELDLATKMGLVAPLEMIAKVVSDEIANARARLLAIPTKFRPDAQVAASTPEKAKRLVSKVEDLIRDALTEIKTYGAE